MTAARLVSLSLAALLTGCSAHTATVPPTAALTPVAPAASTTSANPGLDDPAPDPLRWTYASGEAAGASIQAWRALADYAIVVAARRPANSVPMGLPGAAGGVASVPCASKPPAVVLDVDETAILNTGLEYWLTRSGASSRSVMAQWAATGARAVAPVPGAVTGVRRLREAGIAVIYNTNRDADMAAGTIRALEAAGLGTAVHGKDLFLRGDDALGSDKDGRRFTIASRYCVVALGGDNLGDFAHALNDPMLGVQQRRERAARGDLAQLWGNGWFMIPNAAYGYWQKGTMGEVFPPDVRWEPETSANPADL